MIGSSAAEITVLILRVSKKDYAAFDALYRLTSSKLFGVCRRILREPQEAEEALQEVFVKVWIKADSFTVSANNPTSWMIAIARNHSIDRLRSRQVPHVELESVADLADPMPGPEEAIIRSFGESDRLYKCLDGLGRDRSEIIYSAYVNGDSYADLAARYKMPLNTLRTRLRRGLQKLRECMGG